MPNLHASPGAGSRRADRACLSATLLLTWCLSAPAMGQTCPTTCGDFDADVLITFPDFEDFSDCLGQAPSGDCLCADLNGSGFVDVRDFALFAPLFGDFSDESAPDCTGALGVLANLTAHRPQYRTGYAPFQKLAVAEADEESATLGPGIRRNAPGDMDPATEDDLIEVRLEVDPPGAAVALVRDQAALRVWTTRDRQAGTAIAFDGPGGNRTGPLPIGPAQSELTLWVEWAAASHGTGALRVEPAGGGPVKDTLVFHTFRGIVLALGGENQVPSDPPDANSGTFVIARKLYGLGHDVLMFDEDNVAADGSGAVFNEAATAIRERGVTHVSIYGYSHGGGSTYDLAELLDLSRAGLGVFEIRFTSYADSVSNNSDVDVAQELRRPPSTLYHVNHYQVGSLFEDFNLDGGPVPNSNPPPTGLNVETTPWGAGSTHFTVDDYVQVRDLIEISLEANSQR